MSSSSRLATAIVQIAESRAEVVRKQIETEYVDYFIQIEEDSRGWSIASSRSIFVLTEGGIVAKEKDSVIQELREQRIVMRDPPYASGKFRTAASAVNAMALYGYVSDYPIVFAAKASRFMLRFRVPRELLKAHPEAL